MEQINCIIVDDELIAREIIESYIGKTPSINFLHSFKNVKEALGFISLNKVDLIFLDINMPEISGLTFANVLDKSIKIIFTTAYREYAVDGFNLKAVDYLLKPISFERFTQGIDKYLEIKGSFKEDQISFINPVNDYIFVRSDRKMVKVSFSDIIFVESFSDYIKIHTVDKVLVTRETISNMEAKLPKNLFMRVHRSYILSVLKIESYTNEYIQISDKMIGISRGYKVDVLNRLSNYE